MRDNYAGDEGDYAKYALLRAICSETGLRLGVNWYRTTHDEANNDGGKRRHLADPQGWGPLDPELLDALTAAFGPSAEPSLAAIEQGAVLPADCLFFSEPLPEHDVSLEERVAAREAWHTRALDSLESAGVVFLDPDNGLEAPSVGTTSKDRCKYALDAEVFDYLERGQAVICYQHQPRRKWAEVMEGLLPRLEMRPGQPAASLAQFGPRGFFLLGPEGDLQETLVSAAARLERRAVDASWHKLPIAVKDASAVSEEGSVEPESEDADAASAETLAESSPTTGGGIPLGHLERVEVRQAFPGEARDFTPWLARDDGLRLLGETIGLELQLVGIEQRVGSFFADVLASAEDTLVVVENQFGPSDHSHLGQLMVYAAGRSAGVAVWVCERLRDEHRKALEWLNDSTPQEVNFFGLELEIWRIGDSAAAPKLNVVVRPNEWVKIVRSVSPGTLAAEHAAFFLGFGDWALETGWAEASRLGAQHGNWQRVNLGHAGVALYLYRTSAALRVELRLRERRAAFDALASHRDEIDKAFGEKLVWKPGDGRQVSSIEISQPASDEEAGWPGDYAWLADTAARMIAVLAPRLPTALAAAPEHLSVINEDDAP